MGKALLYAIMTVLIGATADLATAAHENLPQRSVPDKESVHPMPDSQMGGGGMLNEDALRDMNRLMHRMDRVMQDLAQVMSRPQDVDGRHQVRMAFMLDEMSRTMRDMSLQMKQGWTDLYSLAKGRETMDRVEAMLKEMESPSGQP